MATVVLQQHSALREQSSTPPLLGSTLTLNTPRSSTPIPNKHIPYCPPGPAPSGEITPPSSPPQRNPPVKSTSTLHPPHDHPKLLKSPPIYGLSSDSLAAALKHAAEQSLPSSASVFPWLHGLHPNNQTQLQFFVARKKSLRSTPRCLRGITIIKAGGDLSRARMKGAVAPDEVLNLSDEAGKGFIDCDPPEGFSVRNFHIQAAKMAQVSDIVVYGDERTNHRIIQSVAERAAQVQRSWKKDLEAQGQSPETYHTFVLTSTWENFEKAYPEFVAVDSRGKPTGKVLDFLQQERIEMCAMSKASQISQGVYQGPSPNPMLLPTDNEGPEFDLLIECSDHANIPDTKTFSYKSKQLQSRTSNDPVNISFPSSGSMMPSSWAQAEADGILRMCQWIYNLTHVARSTPCTPDKDGDIPMTELTPRTRKVLLHCPDGYTETSLLTVAYYMFAEGVPLHDAWLQLHCDKKRNFFAYASDVALLRSVEQRILDESPASVKISSCPTWLGKFDGSLPSRIMPYMYLGNLTHANNPELLKRLGIKRILSVGEPVSWSKAEWESWGRENVKFVDRVQDNGIDELGTEIEKCIKFIGRGKKEGSATLVHCRVGVSRSATICIAEVMASQEMSFPQAYCFVRARRLNVIIQPHLKFVYELMVWDEIQQERRGNKVQRELEWTTVAREIASLNRPYSRA
ncbi:tyrosine/serine/threonine protein phosphatase pps1 [Lithohypha guttulata]|uniref:tyrosine/serine/threonine protein phosphatase pps1 n=1 Tax=Lithohypha guttulata TaxID=1690604 RepID=UPI002DDF85A7|nr:tyrosine/serine/threonine protein phosphatase pps1 [Lithohypha guttulata]